MSDIAGASNGVHPITRPTEGPEAGEVAHEAYAFACMKCGHGWERAYDIEHHVDGEGRSFVVVRGGPGGERASATGPPGAGGGGSLVVSSPAGARAPPPRTSPDCVNWGAHLVRIMRSGQVSSVLESARRTAPRPVPEARPD